MGLVYWNEEELSWYVRPSQDCKKYTCSETQSIMDVIPLVYIGASREDIDEWLATDEGDDEILNYKDCDGISVIGNRFDNPELLNPPADSPALNTMNIYDPNAPKEQEAAGAAANAEAEAANEQATEGTGEAAATEE
jgi:hypothetical protein